MYTNEQWQDLRDLSAGLGAWFPPALGKLKRAFCSSSMMVTTYDLASPKKFTWFWIMSWFFAQISKEKGNTFLGKVVFAPVMTRALKRSGKIDRTELCRCSATQLEKKGSKNWEAGSGAAAATDPAIGPRHPRQIVVISAISVAAGESSNDCRISFTAKHQQLITELQALLYSL